MQSAFRDDSTHTHALSADGGQQALNLLDFTQSLPDVILLYLNMPIMNGYELLEQLK